MKRKHFDKLLEWKEHYQEKPYILMGARQTGKTYLLKEFCAQNYKDYIYLNFEENEKIKSIFEETLNPEQIVMELSALLGRVINPEDTAIFFDEIQVSERAVSSLKYFCESEKPYKIVCAGSLLGVALKRFTSSYPVGKVVHGYLYPMDFEEFLIALERNDLRKLIEECYNYNKKMPGAVHEMLMKLYKDYLYIGGMPASILEYLKNNQDISRQNRSIKADILNAYIFDMSKYTTSNENIKINKLYKSLPRQLNKDNTKFTYKLVEEGATKRDYETSIDWLTNSGLVLNCRLIEHPEIPLMVHANDNLFKIYPSDVGLLSELSGLGAGDYLSENFSRHMGMLAESYMAQTLKANGYDLYYWKSKRNAELDFLLHKDGKIIPVEVKSSSNTKAQSLRVYIERYEPEFSLKISGRNFGFANSIKSIPLYAAYLL